MTLSPNTPVTINIDANKKMSNMKTSKQGLEFIASWEGLELTPYKDAAGLLTIGVGHLIKPSEVFTKLTHDDALQLFADDIDPREQQVSQLITRPDIKQHQFDAFVSLTFNIGIGAFKNSSALKLFNSYAFDSTVGARFLPWNKAGGRVLKGLVRRRQAEKTLFETGQYLNNGV
jgi:lysozyme